MDRLEEMRRDALFVDAINREVFKGGLALQATENPDDISTIVTIQDKAISRLYLQEGINGFSGVQAELPGAFSEEMDSNLRVQSLTVKQLDPIDGTGDLDKSTSKKHEEFRQKYGVERKPYGATNLISLLERSGLGEKFTPTAGMIFDFVDEVVVLGDGKTTELYRIDNGKLIPIKWKLQQKYYRAGEPIRLGHRIAYPHKGFDKFVEYLKDQKKLELCLVKVGGAGRWAEQLFRTNVKTDGPVPADWEDTAIDVVFNYQPDHKTWDLDPTLVLHGNLGVTKPTDVYGDKLTANAALAPYTGESKAFDPLAWHKKGYLYSARGQALHDTLAQCAMDFERDTGYRVLDK